MIGILITVSMIAITFLTDNILIKLLFINPMWLVMQVFLVVILELKLTTQSIKSKHSAEHMMVNFLKKIKDCQKV